MLLDFSSPPNQGRISNPRAHWALKLMGSLPSKTPTLSKVGDNHVTNRTDIQEDGDAAPPDRFTLHTHNATHPAH